MRLIRNILIIIITISSINVSSQIIKDTILITRSNSPFLVLNDYYISDTTILYIEKGSVLIISDSVNIIVFGKLIVEGSKKNKIVFKSTNESTSWGRIIGRPNSKIRIRNANIINGAISAESSNIYIANSNFSYYDDRKFDGKALFLIKYSQSFIVNNNFRNYTDKWIGEGLNFVGGRAECINNSIKGIPDAVEFTKLENSLIQANTISFSGDDGIDVNASNNIIIRNNLIKNIDDKAITIGGDQSFIKSKPYLASKNIFISNNIINTSGIGVSVTDSSFVELKGNTIYRNDTGIKLYEKNKNIGAGFLSLDSNCIWNNETDIITNDSSRITYKGNMNIIDSSDCNIILDSSTIINNSELPTVFINTYSKVIIDDERIDGEFVVFKDSLKINSGQLTIEIRGASSVEFPKKSYGISIKEQSLLGLPKEKDWVLYGPWYDKSALRNAVVYSLGDSLSIKSPKYKFVNLIVNGNEKGLYLLIQKIKRDTGFVDVEKNRANDNSASSINGGYIFKNDKGAGANHYKSLCLSLNSKYVPYYLHYPKPKNVNKLQQEYIIDYISKFEKALVMEPCNLNYIDTNSFVDYVIITELMKNIDGYRASVYFYKYRFIDKVFLGPIWDFNMCAGNTENTDIDNMENFVFEISEGYRKYIPVWWYSLLSDEIFANLIENRWNYLRLNSLSDKNINSLISNLSNEIDQYGNQYEIERLRYWLHKRTQWLDDNIHLVNERSKDYKISE